MRVVLVAIKRSSFLRRLQLLCYSFRKSKNGRNSSEVVGLGGV